MPDSTPNWRKGRIGYSIYELLLSWWRHRASFLISLGITLASLTLYYFTFLKEDSAPILEFFKRFEYSTLDTRFRYRSPKLTPPDNRIVIVSIDQRSQEILGKWPFSRKYFAQTLDALHDDGAKVVAFDITFDKPDLTAEPVRALWMKLEERKKRGEKIDPKTDQQIREVAREYDVDSQFGEAIRRFGPVVLGNFYMSEGEVRGIDSGVLDKYAEMVQWYALNRRSLRSATGKEDFVTLLNNYEFHGMMYNATIANIPQLANADNNQSELTAVGFFNAASDADGVLRRGSLVLPFGRSNSANDIDLYGSMEVETLRLYFGLKTEQITVNYLPDGIDTIAFGDRLVVRPDWLGRVLVNYRGPRETYPYYSIADVVQKRIPPGTFKDKIVIVGATATGIADLRTPPYGNITYPGVELHANVVDNLLNHQSLVRGPAQEWFDLGLMLLFGLPLGFAMALVPPRWMWYGMSLILGLVALDYFAFLRGYWLNFTFPAMTLTGNVILVSLYRALIEEKEKRRVRTAFGQYLSPEVIRRLLLNPELVEPRKTEISVMFSDIRGFTTISEKLDAQDLAHFLNLYLSDMTRIVFDRHGTLDKYIGDAVMAFWGAPFEEPGHATRACESSLDMMKRVIELQKQWEAEGKPRLDIGIGLNTGVASVGNMGSSLRYGYTALGDSVNLSSRLEGLNKDYGTHIIVNESTYNAVKDSDFVFRELDLIRVKGKLQPVTIYELVGRATDVSTEIRNLLAQFVTARALYQSRGWLEAQQAFQSILESNPTDGPSRTYWKRCQEYLFDEPPLNWDGVFTMDHK
ncbi:MAG TPA: adenylate/guanylate cyclase domain-containing protein [Candidatus Dormibacteraeota bacterium]|nr:adenylate/guanylate cyclase domain-containing protein [Candidatus Dormibacteraeota bacterium]